MLCPLCHTQNRDNARFCKGCGQSLAVEVVVTGQPEVGEQQDTVDQAQTQGTPPSSPLSVEAAHGEDAATEVVTPTSEAPEDEVAQKEVAVNEPGMHVEEDVSQAPTQILTPQQMQDFHVRRWKQDAEREHVPGEQYADIADAPTLLIRPQSSSYEVNALAASQWPQEPNIADAPTMSMPMEPVQTPAASAPPVDAGVSASVTTLAETEAASAPSAGPKNSGAEVVSETSASAEKDQAASSAEVSIPQDAASAIPAKENIVEPNTNENEIATTTNTITEQPEHVEPPVQSTSAETFPVLALGSRVGERYEISQVLSEDEHEHTYVVTDHQGYQHCWNCDSEQNAEGDEFCIDCGAELLNASYVLHEYPASAQQGGEAQVLQGSIANTFVAQGLTYVVEQPQATQTSFPNGVHLIGACDSDAGTVRRAEPNEDSTLSMVLERVHESISSPAGLFVVADGMGGHANGQGASRTTIALIAERVTRELFLAPLQAEKAGEPALQQDDEYFKELLRSAIEDANTSLCQINQKEKSDQGSTLTGFMIVGDHAYIFNVGDSRTYMLRDEKLYQLTNDHSLVGQLVAGGLIEPDDVYTHPQRNQIFRSIGDKQNVQVDLFTQQVHPGDVLLSCSDGLWEMIRDPQITELLNQAPDPQTACSQLLEAANTNGGEDNVSAVVVFVR